MAGRAHGPAPPSFPVTGDSGSLPDVAAVGDRDPQPTEAAGDGALAEIRRDVLASFRALGATFRNANLRRSLIGLTAFSICEWGGYIALVVFAFGQGGTEAVGVIALVQLIPAAIIAPIGSVLGDRFPRERVLLLALAAITLTAAASAIAALAGAPAVVVYAAGCSVGYVLTLVRPTHGALLPWIANDPTELTSAYSASGLVESSCVLVGPVLVTASFALADVFGISGPGLAYAVMAALLVVGTWAVARIRVARGEEQPAEAVAGPGLLREFGAGFRLVWSDRRPRMLVWMLGLGMLTLGFLDSLIVVIAFDLLGAGETAVGILNSTMGAGAIVGALLALVAGARERLFPAFRSGTIAYGSSVAAIAAVPPAAPLLLGAGGAGGVLMDVSARTMLQRLIPDEKLTRSFGVLEAAYLGFEGIGAFLGAALAIAIGPRWTLLIAGSLLLVSGFVLRQRLRVVDVGPRVPAEDLALLRGTAIFAPLPPVTLERVARNTVPLTIRAGGVLIRQGDVGDRFYVVAAGTLTVSANGREVATLGPAGHVGEIALLRDVPRTATVTAATEARLLSLERDEFLRALTGHEPSHAAAQTATDDRLRDLGGGHPDPRGHA